MLLICNLQLHGGSTSQGLSQIIEGYLNLDLFQPQLTYSGSPGVRTRGARPGGPGGVRRARAHTMGGVTGVHRPARKERVELMRTCRRVQL